MRHRDAGSVINARAGGREPRCSGPVPQRAVGENTRSRRPPSLPVVRRATAAARLHDRAAAVFFPRPSLEQAHASAD